MFFLLSLSTAYATGRGPYATNAIAIVNTSIIKIETPEYKPTPFEVATEMFASAISNSYHYNNSEEIEKFVDYVKANKLESQFKERLTRDIPSMRKRVKYEIEWTTFRYFVNTNGVGLLDQNEFLSIKNRLIELQKLRFQKSKNVNWAKDDLKIIDTFDKKYKEVREQTIARNRQNCQDSVEWDKLFSPRKGQTDTGWCYAFGYADFLEANYGQSVSAADLVLQYRQYRMKEERDSYNRSAALYNKPLLSENHFIPVDYIYQGGEYYRISRKKAELSLCSEIDLRSEARDEEGQPVAMGLIIDWINELGLNFYKGKTTKDEVVQKLKAFDYKQIFPNADIDIALKKMGENKDLYILLAEETCNNKRFSIVNDKSDWVNQGYSFEHNLASSLDKVTELLSTGPVLVSINDNFLWKENIWGKGKISNHILLITGKRWNEDTKHCELKIRNSQTTYSGKEEKVWYKDSEIMRNVDEIYMKSLLLKK